MWGPLSCGQSSPKTTSVADANSGASINFMGPRYKNLGLRLNFRKIPEARVFIDCMLVTRSQAENTPSYIWTKFALSFPISAP